MKSYQIDPNPTELCNCRAWVKSIFFNKDKASDQPFTDLPRTAWITTLYATLPTELEFSAPPETWECLSSWAFTILSAYNMSALADLKKAHFHTFPMSECFFLEPTSSWPMKNQFNLSATKRPSRRDLNEFKAFIHGSIVNRHGESAGSRSWTAGDSFKLGIHKLVYIYGILLIFCHPWYIYPMFVSWLG